MPFFLIYSNYSLFFRVNTISIAWNWALKRAQCDRWMESRKFSGRVVAIFLTFEIEIKGNIHVCAHLIVWCYSFTKYWLLSMCFVIFLVQWLYGQYSQELTLAQRFKVLLIILRKEYDLWTNLKWHVFIPNLFKNKFEFINNLLYQNRWN